MNDLLHRLRENAEWMIDLDIDYSGSAPLHKEAAARIEYLEGILKIHLKGFFVCGHAGKMDENRLPDYVLVCPEFGSDLVVKYKKEECNEDTQRDKSE